MSQTPREQHQQRLIAAGLPAAGVADWLTSLERASLPPAPDPARLDADAKGAADSVRRGWSLLARLPLRSKRNALEKAAGEAIVTLATDLCRAVARAHHDAIYRRLTDDYTRHVRVDELVFKAAQLWPGLVPTQAELTREMERTQADKDGLEIFQGGLISELMTVQRSGLHLMNSMLRPTPEALTLLEEFQRSGVVDLEFARVEARGETGYLYVRHPQYLNAEDGETVRPQEVGVDLILLHPGLKMGVLRGDVVDHPRYQGRRVFNAGLNLTKVYYGKLPYLFYIVRDMGFVNKLYRGLAVEEFDLERPETTLEKPWMAVVEAFAIGGGCQLLLVMDYVIAEAGSYFNLPARKEGIIPGCANLRLPRFVGERIARAGIMFDKKFSVESPEAAMMINEVVPRAAMDAAVDQAVANAIGSGMVSASGNRKAMRVQTEPLEAFRKYMAVYAYEQARCHLSDQLVANLERHWNAKQRRLLG